MQPFWIFTIGKRRVQKSLFCSYTVLPKFDISLGAMKGTEYGQNLLVLSEQHIAETSFNII
jgi:hypothetical protein